MTEIFVVCVAPSTCCDTTGAIDAEVMVGDIDGEVTLVPSEYDGRLDSWGDLSHWASESLHGLDRETLGKIVAEVRAAAASL